MTQYDWQLLCAKQCDKIYIIIFFRNGFLLDCNHSLANSYYIMSSNVWVGLVCGGGGLGWSGVGSYNFSHKNRVVWVQFGFQPIYGTRCDISARNHSPLSRVFITNTNTHSLTSLDTDVNYMLMTHNKNAYALLTRLLLIISIVILCWPFPSLHLILVNKKRLLAVARSVGGRSHQRLPGDLSASERYKD